MQHEHDGPQHMSNLSSVRFAVRAVGPLNINIQITPVEQGNSTCPMRGKVTLAADPVCDTTVHGVQQM